MSRKNKAKMPEPCHDGGNNTNFGMIREGLLKNDIFKRLSIGERYFYVTCQVQAKTRIGRQCLFNHADEEGKNYNADLFFVFPAKHLAEYGYDAANGSRYLRKLIAKGFIEKVEYNKHRKKVNVYKFSEKWKDGSRFDDTEKEKESASWVVQT